MLRMLAIPMLQRPLLSSSCGCGTQVRFFWEYVNKMFNNPDPERIKLVGPDRACAEWVLRNGGTITWASGETLDNYNFLPAEGVKQKLTEIDGSNSSISHYGFPHLSGCTNLKKITLHNNKYIEDQALKGLSFGKETLKYVQVSHCVNVTDVGLKDMKILTKLDTLIMFGLQGVKNLEECKNTLKSHLPNCKIEDKEPIKQGASN